MGRLRRASIRPVIRTSILQDFPVLGEARAVLPIIGKNVPQSRLSAYLELPPHSQVMLECLALANGELQEAELLSAARVVCQSLRIPLNGASQMPVLTDLLGKGLATRLKKGDCYECARPIRQDVAARSLGALRARVVFKHFAKVVPQSLASLKKDAKTGHKVWTEVFSGEPMRLKGRSDAEFECLQEIAAGFSEPDSLDALELNLAFFLAQIGLHQAVAVGGSAATLGKWLAGARKSIQRSEFIDIIEQMYRLYGISHGSSAEDVAKEKTFLGELIASVLGSADAYRRTLAEQSRNGLSLRALPFIRILLLAGILRHGSEGETRFVDWKDVDVEGYLCDLACDLHFGDAKLGPSFLRDLGLNDDWRAGDYLMLGLVCLWLGHLPGLTQISDELASTARTFREGGVFGLAEAAAELVRRAKGDEPKPHWLVDAYQPLSRDARRLQELLAWSRSHQTRQAAQSERLVWVVEKTRGHWDVTARVQKIGKDGNWTAGRVRELHNLLYDTPDFCDHHDLAALVGARQAFDRRFASISMEERTIEALVGHPRVFFGPHRTPVQLVASHPRLRVHQRKGGVRVRLEPDLPSGRAVQIQQAAPDRLEVFSLTSSQSELVELLGNGWLEVPEAQVQELRDALPTVAIEGVHLDSDLSVGDAVREVPADSALRLRLSPDGLGLAGELLVRPFGDWGPTAAPGKGGQSMIAEREGESLQAVRDLRAEKTKLRQVQEAVPFLSQVPLRLPDPQDGLELLEALLELQPGLLQVEWPEGQPFRVSQRALAMPLASKAQQDWLELEGELKVGEDRVLTLQAVLEMVGASRGRFLSLGDGEYLALTRELRARLDVLSLLGEKGAKGTVRLHPLAAAMAAPDTLASVGGAWAERRSLLEEAGRLKPRVPAGFKAELRSYQREGLNWLCRLAHWKAGACLADDMGLGKTIQALALLQRRAKDGPALVVAPTSVCPNWADEAARFAPDLKVRLLAEHDRESVLAAPGPDEVVLCSYGLLVKESERLNKTFWQTVILDEAQSIKNHATQRFKAAVELRADFRLATTGTPIENHLEELWTLFRFLNPGLLGSRTSFTSRFAKPIAAGDVVARETLRSLVRPFILRRTKKDVLKELPPKTEITLSVELSEAEMALYEGLRRSAVEAMARQGDTAKLFVLLSEMMKLRRACCHPRLVLPDTDMGSSKLELLCELLAELKENGHRALVFSQFVDHLSLVRERLDSSGYQYQYLDGSTAIKRRKEAVAAFQDGQGDLFLISLKAGGVGLNLTAADYVIHLDPWWNPAVEDQASDRAHRMGQQKPVTVYRLVAGGTIEQKIVALHQTKRDLAERLLEGTDKVGKVDVEELMALLQSGSTAR